MARIESLYGTTPAEIFESGLDNIGEIEGVAGVHIMGIEWEESIRPIAQSAGLLPRPVVEI